MGKGLFTTTEGGAVADDVTRVTKARSKDRNLALRKNEHPLAQPLVQPYKLLDVSVLFVNAFPMLTLSSSTHKVFLVLFLLLSLLLFWSPICEYWRTQWRTHRRTHQFRIQITPTK